jgi:hypothetical protein
MSDAVRWLAFELRRARGALMEIVAMLDDLGEKPEMTRMRFVANRALSLYQEVSVPEAKSLK